MWEDVLRTARKNVFWKTLRCSGLCLPAVCYLTVVAEKWPQRPAEAAGNGTWAGVSRGWWAPHQSHRHRGSEAKMQVLQQ